MHLSARLLLAASLTLATLAPLPALAEPSVIYLVRHGEKAADSKDPDLTEQGKARAQNIATILQKTGITSIYSSTTNRTKQTAQPLAARSGLEVQTYDPSAPKALVEKVKSQNGAVLVVGHSNTLPELVRLFGGTPGADISDNEYDRLYQLIVGPNGAITTVLLTSIPATGPAK
ncbi:SixA phosphatase family protein [Pseudoduganella sp. GCM10020061]|uniref:SixA phosphatase family protein n=1 Tax=Pseudoduganella sp. GCM10020061 TaxID=3317345 RepID=UPI003629B96C